MQVLSAIKAAGQWTEKVDAITSEDYALGILAGCGGLLFGAQLLEHAAGMEPCPLCLMQRLWFFAAGFIALAGLMHNPRWGIYPLLTIAAALTGGGFSIRQLWLQSLPPEQAPACGAGINYMLENLPWSQVLQAMMAGTGDCAEEPPLLGLPIPLWALAGFAAIIAAAALQWRTRSSMPNS